MDNNKNGHVTAKKIEDRIPLLCVEDDFLISIYGEHTRCFRVDLPEIFTLSEEEYEALHQTILKALKLLPHYTIVHKQDWFVEESYKMDLRGDDPSFLGRAFETHFYDRKYLNHYCYLYITMSNKNHMKRKSNNVSLLRGKLVEKEFLDQDQISKFNETLGQFQRILNDTGLMKLHIMTEEELMGKYDGQTGGLIDRYMNLSTEDHPVLLDYELKPELKIGENLVNCFTISGLEDLPNSVASDRRFDKYSTDKTDFRLGFCNAVGLNLPCNHIYNQYMFIEDSAENILQFEKKSKNLLSLSKYSRENGINKEWNDLYMNEAISNAFISIRSHFNIFIWTDDAKKMPELRNLTSSAIASMDMKPRLNTLDRNKLWQAGIPGCSVDFPNEETFYTFFEQATCLWNLETCYRTSTSSFGLKMVDRMSMKPIFIDISDQPMKDGIITNRNKFILGPSGSGKSFFTNHMVRQYYEQGTHVLLVDTGNSYQGLCDLVRQKTKGKDGVYFTYKEDDPISFNPFYTEDGIFELEKKESIKTLLITLWKKDEEPPTRSEEVALSDAINLYLIEIRKDTNIEPSFNTFYEFVRTKYKEFLEIKKVRDSDFDINSFLYTLSPFYKGGEYDYLLNSMSKLDLLNKRFIVFELDNIKDHKVLFPVVTIIIMETFINKMRKLKGIRKMILIEEAWKAIAKEGMAEYIKYLFKTVRKFFGEAIIVTQEVDDIIHSPIVKESIINNSDCKILLDQGKYMNKFDDIKTMLGLTNKQVNQILSVNQGKHPGRFYKEVFIALGSSKSAVYATEVSRTEYAVYTTEEKEKLEIFKLAEKFGGNMELAVTEFAQAG